MKTRLNREIRHYNKRQLKLHRRIASSIYTIAYLVAFAYVISLNFHTHMFFGVNITLLVKITVMLLVSFVWTLLHC